MNTPKDINAGDALDQLAWLIEMGADEVVGDQPVDRFAASAERLQQARQAPAAANRAPCSPRKTTARQATPPASNEAAVQDSRQLAGSCQSLADIEQALIAFDACPLKRTASNLCYADGNADARVMFIGEAPGRDEDIQGKPFVGRSGQLLDKMLIAIGLDRASTDAASAAFITNVIYWRPPGNRKPTDIETLMCMPFVERTIELQAPDFIVCLGATPMQRLTGRTEGILKSRGRWMEMEVAGRAMPLIATLHPAYLLRQPAQKRLAWRDFLEIRHRLDG
ncbi:MAG: uracil-DNA glycosylase [Aestuariivirgaceae bacterium]